ncbi:MAG: enoyl-CoA hydratase-related protein [Desulforhopalus sp.]|jgi:enoyl-CoA hydratase|nr:enoyl-CoA hydratase-related protein [Desulforhopalus sp.]
MELNNIILTKGGGIATLTVNRPKSLNALNRETLEELLRCCRELAEDQEVRVVIITGTGEKAFIAGADISAMQPLDALAAREFGRLGHRVMAAIESLPQPVIAAINGFALGGGCELALACDIRLAADNARFGQPEVNLGVVPGFGGTQRLPRLIGKGPACELLFSGEMIDAAEALRLGLVNRVVPRAELQTVAVALAEKIASRGPLAVRLCKEAVNKGLEMGLAEACAHEAELFALCFASAEQKEGMAAFLEKRPARF